MPVLEGATVLVTGASRGIGAAAARAFAEAGARVTLAARGTAETGPLAEELGGRAVACDVSDFAQVEAAVAAASEGGRLDVLVNNAGTLEPVARMEDLSAADYGRIVDVNLKGVFHGMRAALPGMLARGGGTILTIGSGAAHGPVEGWAHYCSSKAGALMLTRMLHKENGENGIRAISLSPGTVATQMQREIAASGINPVSRLDWSDHIPPEWVGACLVWMAGPAGDAHLGGEVSLRDPEVRAAIGVA